MTNSLFWKYALVCSYFTQIKKDPILLDEDKIKKDKIKTNNDKRKTDFYDHIYVLTEFTEKLFCAGLNMLICACMSF